MNIYHVRITAENGDWIYNGEAVFHDDDVLCEDACGYLESALGEYDFISLNTPCGKRSVSIRSSSVMKVEVAEVKDGE